MSYGSSTNSLLSVSVEHGNGVARIRLGGELDVASRHRVEQALLAAESHAPTALVLELDSLEFMDSTGLNAFADALQRAKEAGRAFHVRGSRNEVRRIIGISGLHLLFESAATASPESLNGSVEWEPVSLSDGVPSG
jgi:anti-anti-sigma factor